MKLRIVERKHTLKESDQSSTLEVSMPALSYIKLTTSSADFEAINKFINKFLNDEKFKADVINTNLLKKRKAFIEKKLGNLKTDLSVDLLLRVINFIKPADDAQMYGMFNPEKSGTVSLAVQVNGDVGKVKNHEGRNRTLSRYIKGETRVNASIAFFGAQVNTVQQMPATLISQFDDTVKVFRGDISPAEEKDKSSFKTIEGFINNLGPFPKQSIIDELSKKTIKVAGKEVILKKAAMVDKGPDGKYYTSIFKVGLYDKEVLNVPKTDGVEYWVEVDKHKISPEKGPVQIT